MSKISPLLKKWGYPMAGFGLALVVLAYFQFWFLPKQRGLRELESKTTQLQTEVDKNSIALVGLRSRPKIAENKTESAILNRYLTTDQNVVEVVKRLIAEDPQLETRLIRSEPKVKAKDANDKTPGREVTAAKESPFSHELTFNIEIVGSFFEIGAFVERLESSPILTEIQALDISRVGSDLEKCLAKISVQASLFNEGEND